MSLLETPSTLAEKAFAEAEQLSQQGAVAEKRQAIIKYQEALSLWQTVGDRILAVKALQGIANVHSSLGESRAAIEQFKAALAILSDSSDLANKASLLLSLGMQYNILSEAQQALEPLNQAIALYQAQQNPVMVALGSLSIGISYTNVGDLSAALTAYRQAHTTFQEQKLTSYEAQSLSSIANLHHRKGETQQALDVYQQAFTLHQSNSDIAGQISILEAIGGLYLEIGQPQKAVDQLLSAIALQQNDILGQVVTLGQLSLAYLVLGDVAKLQETRQQVVQLQQAIQSLPIDPNQPLPAAQLAGMYSAIATTYSFSESSKAIDLYTQALAILRASESHWIEAQILRQLATVYDTIGEKQQALDTLHQALSIYQARQDRSQTAILLRDIADLHASLGNAQTALDQYQQVLDLQQQIGNRPEAALTLRKAAELYRTLGDDVLSLDAHSQALELFRSIGNRSQEAITLDKIGTVHREMKRGAQALDYYMQALQITDETAEFAMKISVLSSLIRVYELLNDDTKALEMANKALSLSRDRQDRFNETASLSLLGLVYLHSKAYAEGIKVMTEAIQNWQQLGIRQAEANALHNLGKLYTATGRKPDAIAAYQQELVLLKVLGNRVSEADTLYEMAVTERTFGDLRAAKSNLKLALETVEDLRVQVISPELRVSYFSTVQKYYQFYIDLLMQLHRSQPDQGFDALALHVNERARARSLSDLLTEAKINIRAGVNPQLLEQEKLLRQQLSALEAQRLAIATSPVLDEAQLKRLEQQTDSLLIQYRVLQSQIRASNPQYASLTQPQPLTLSEIQQQVLDEETALLEYSLGEDRSHLWIATKTNLIHHELPNRAAIESAAKALLSVLKDPVERTFPDSIAAVAEPLSQMIFAPFANTLPHRLLIVSDGILQYIPFAALPIWKPDPVPLVVEHEIVSSPSASVIVQLRQRDRAQRSKQIAIFADPVFSLKDERLGGHLSEKPLALRKISTNFDRLPQTLTEAKNILSLLPKQADQQELVSGFDATLKAVKDPDLANYRSIHFATHGVLESDRPALSGVVLSLVDPQGNPQDGFLRLHEIFNLHLPADLVVLSACETALGQDKPGEGSLGLTRGFLYAGAARMVVSLWTVGDEATAALMTRFYQAMVNHKLPPTAALRQAQVEMMPTYNSPYSWAGFIIQGEWTNNGIL
jgi:CHAT domain-containing protein/tetratricopeptide (TPR) repeat protein